MIELKTKIQAIYFMTTENELGITHATSNKRITLAEAEEILSERQIEHNQILKVQYENIKLTIPLAEYEYYIK